jgi:lysophospholipase L1-like esterase
MLRRRALGLLVALLAAVGLVGVAAPAASASPVPRAHPTYLALGDSVPFGYRANLPPIFYNFPQLFVGYPEMVGPTLGLRTLNAACPGETTDSFLTGVGSNGCEDSFNGPTGYRDVYPLHVNYSGTQMDYALNTLESNQNVQLVTVMLGANDGFLCSKTVEPYCNGPTDIAGIAFHVRANLESILGELRSHYNGQIIIVTYYALNYGDPAGLAATEALNRVITDAALDNAVTVADGFGAFQQRALAAGGSSIAAGLVLPGDVHPTLLGQFLLARAVERVVQH